MYFFFHFKVSDWTTDFCDGTHLCTLVESLQKRPLKSWNRRPANQHHYLENATVALSAIEGDGIKLVNIGEPLFHNIQKYDHTYICVLLSLSISFSRTIFRLIVLGNCMHNSLF